MMMGVDVSKDRLDLALEGPSRNRCYERQVRNDAGGFKRLLSWAKERTGVSPEGLTVVMEATGVYHEALAEALHEAGCRVFVVNPKRVRDYALGLGLLNKTDRVDARALLRYGQQRQSELVPWMPPALYIRTLRALYARLEAVEKDLQRELNRKGQADLTNQPEAVRHSLEHSIERLQEDSKRLKRAIEDHIDQHPDLKEQRKCSKASRALGRSARRCCCVSCCTIALRVPGKWLLMRVWCRASIGLEAA